MRAESTHERQEAAKGERATVAQKLKETYCKSELVRISVIKIKKIQVLGDIRKFEVR